MYINNVHPDLRTILFVVCTVMFEQTAYSVDEDDGPAQPVLVLSNPSSTDTIVEVRDTEITATSE